MAQEKLDKEQSKVTTVDNINTTESQNNIVDENKETTWVEKVIKNLDWKLNIVSC